MPLRFGSPAGWGTPAPGGVLRTGVLDAANMYKQVRSWSRSQRPLFFRPPPPPSANTGKALVDKATTSSRHKQVMAPRQHRLEVSCGSDLRHPPFKPTLHRGGVFASYQMDALGKPCQASNGWWKGGVVMPVRVASVSCCLCVLRHTTSWRAIAAFTTQLALAPRGCRVWKCAGRRTYYHQ